MLIENDKELLREFINKYPNNFNLGIELRKIMPNNHILNYFLKLSIFFKIFFSGFLLYSALLLII